MSLSLVDALTWCARLSALSVALQTLELLQIRAAYADQGVWSWPILKEEHAALPLPLRALLGALLPYRAFLALLVVRLPLAGLLAMGFWWCAPLLLVSQLAIGARFRGTFNGGSDYMTVVVLSGLSAAAGGLNQPLLLKAGLAYVTVQLVLSYFIAGCVKVSRSEWRRGEALRRLLSSNRYGTPAWISVLVAKPPAARLAAGALLAFECGFPLALVGPRMALPFMACGALFHLGNAAAFGLNRFLFAWVAAYPALLYFSAQLAISSFIH
ncbi:MAG TPA: hypothetical protein VHB79_37620 [Polyangiaceae bacterium]|nr:hypothetical protein [Polyangiaceae bacterium]